MTALDAGEGDEEAGIPAAGMLGGSGGLGPAYTRGEVEAPAGKKEMLGFMANVYTAEQQARLGINEIGEARTQDEADKHAVELQANASEMESMLVSLTTQAISQSTPNGPLTERVVVIVMTGGGGAEAREHAQRARGARGGEGEADGAAGRGAGASGEPGGEGVGDGGGRQGISRHAARHAGEASAVRWAVDAGGWGCVDAGGYPTHSRQLGDGRLARLQARV